MTNYCQTFIPQTGRSSANTLLLNRVKENTLNLKCTKYFVEFHYDFCFKLKTFSFLFDVIKLNCSDDIKNKSAYRTKG